MDTKAKKELTLAEIQAREYELLTYFDAYCKRHGLTYCLCGGTLLGAVRHKGFIPWDDDIDLMMPRKDYERLRGLSRTEPVCGYLRVRYPGDDAYPYGFMKIVDTRTIVYERNITRDAQRTGLALDIFPPGQDVHGRLEKPSPACAHQVLDTGGQGRRGHGPH